LKYVVSLKLMLLFLSAVRELVGGGSEKSIDFGRD
jgi:hypothetical protein